MNALLILLAALVLLLCAGLVVLGCKYLHRRWQEVANALEYRTADWSAIDSQTRALQRSVPSPAKARG